MNGALHHLKSLKWLLPRHFSLNRQQNMIIHFADKIKSDTEHIFCWPSTKNLFFPLDSLLHGLYFMD